MRFKCSCYVLVVALLLLLLLHFVWFDKANEPVVDCAASSSHTCSKQRDRKTTQSALITVASSRQMWNTFIVSRRYRKVTQLRQPVNPTLSEDLFVVITAGKWTHDQTVHRHENRALVLHEPHGRNITVLYHQPVNTGWVEWKGSWTKPVFQNKSQNMLLNGSVCFGQQTGKSVMMGLLKTVLQNILEPLAMF